MSDLRIEEVDEMYGRLDRARKSRVWFGPDAHLLDSLNEAQAALRRVVSDLAVEGHGYRRPGCQGECCRASNGQEQDASAGKASEDK